VNRQTRGERAAAARAKEQWSANQWEERGELRGRRENAGKKKRRGKKRVRVKRGRASENYAKGGGWIARKTREDFHPGNRASGEKKLRRGRKWEGLS